MSGELLPSVPQRGAKVSARQVAGIEREVASQLAAIDDIEVLNDWRAKARALEMYLRDKALKGPMAGAQRRVEARIGELLGEAKRDHDRQKGAKSVVTDIEKHDRADFRLLARAYNGCQLNEEEWRKSRRALVKLIRKRAGLMPETPALPDGIFRTIVADPPWTLDTGPEVFGGDGDEGGHDALAYPVMSVEEITDLPVKDHAADDAHLYLWTTNRYVERAYSVTRAWGFKPSVLLVWAKTPRGVGLGDAFKLTTEFILYARRGKLEESDISETTWFNWPRGKHSEKPDEFYELVERISPAAEGDRLEMFARRERPGWEAWGAD